jgi:hypothetical protein
VREERNKMGIVQQSKRGRHDRVNAARIEKSAESLRKEQGRACEDRQERG